MDLEIGGLRGVLELEAAAFQRGVAQAQRSMAAMEAKLGAVSKTVATTGARVDAAGGRMATVFQRLQRSSQGTAGGLQNAAYQAQDFFAQIAAGTDVSRAAAQQLPQLLSGFGLFGVLAGTAAAIVPTLATAVLGLGDNAMTLEKALEGVNDALTKTSDLAKIAQGDLDGLKERYGTLTPQVLSLVEAQKQVGLRQLADSAKALNEQLTALYNGNAWLNVSRAEDLANGLGLGTKASRELANSLTALGQAQSLDDQLAILEAIRTRFVEMVGPIGQMTTAQRDFAFSIIDAEAVTRELKNRVDEVAASVNHISGPLETAVTVALALNDAASAMAGYFDAAGVSAAGMANSIADAARNAWDAVGAMGQARRLATMPGASMRNGDDERGQQRDERRSVSEYRTDTWMEAYNKRTKAASGGGGGGGLSDQQREAARVFEETRTAAERYALEMEKINTLHSAGAIDTDTFNRAVALLKGEIDDTASAAKALESSFGTAFSALVTGAGSAQEAIGALLGDLAKMLANSAFKSLIGDGKIFGSLAGMLGFANGAAFSGGRVTAFATGGIVSSPTVFPMAKGAGLMGEAGPEAIMPLTRIGGKLGVLAKGAGGGGLTIQVDARYASEGTADMIVRALQESAPGIVRQAVAASRGAAARGY
jgi:hypothetical protein